MVRPHNVPLPQRKQFKMELDRQCDEGIMRKLSPEEAENAEWGFPMFGVPKKNKREIRTVVDYRKLNRVIKRNPCYIEPMHDLIMSVGQWKWGSEFDLNMGYHAMKSCEKTRIFMRIVTIFGMCEPLVLAMGVAPASDAFQRRTSNLVIDAKPKPPKCYVDDILAAIDHTHDEHIACIDNVFAILEDAGLQINLKKSALC